MRTKQSVLILLTMLLSCMAMAQNTRTVLPSPVFSNKPAEVDVILKNVNVLDKMPEDIIIKTSNPMMGFRDHEYLTRIRDCKSEGNTCIYHAEIQTWMTCPCMIQVASLGLAKYTKDTFYAVIVPGERTVCTIDCRKQTVRYEGAFAKLNAECARCFVKDGIYNPFGSEVFNKLGDKELLDRYKDVEPKVFLEQIIGQYREKKNRLFADRSWSAEFKEVWLCYAAKEIRHSYSPYANSYNIVHHATTSLSKDIPDDLTPFGSNSIFYVYGVGGTMLGIGSDQKTKLSDDEHKLYEAIDRNMHLYFSTLKPDMLPTLKKLHGEYYDMLKMINDRLQAKIDKGEARPEIGTLCEIDRSLQGEDFCKALLDRYKGRTTIVKFDFSSIFGEELYSYVSSIYGDTIPFVFLTGGENASEAEMHRQMKEYKGDYYYLMGSQLEDFVKTYWSGNEMNPYSHGALIFDKDGNFALDYTNYQPTGPAMNESNKNSDIMDIIDQIADIHNFTVHGTVSPGIEDIGYDVVSYLKKDSRVMDTRITRNIPATNRRFTYSVYMSAPRIGYFQARFSDGSLCSHVVRFPFIPGEECNLKVMNGAFYVTAEKGFYKDWAEADELVENASRYHTAEETSAILHKYIREHSDNPAVILLYLNSNALPLEEITSYISDEMMQGRFGEVIGSYTGER